MSSSTDSQPETSPSYETGLLAELRAQARAEKRRRENDRAWRESFEEFCRRVDIITKSGARTKLELNPIQRKYCERRTVRDIILKPRQIGFTTLELARDIWTFLAVPGARVVIVVQSLTDHSPLKQLSSAIRVMFEGLRSSGVELKFRTDSLSEWALEGSDASMRIIEAGASEAAAEKKGRSGTITRLHLTEVAFYEYAESTLNALLECVPGVEFGSEIVIESTANGAGGWFFSKYKKASPLTDGYTTHFFSWLEHPEYRVALAPGEVFEVANDNARERELVDKFGATPEQIKWYRAKVADKSQDLVDQEYPVDAETCWLTSGRLFFDVHRTKAILAEATSPIEVRAVGKEGSQGTLRLWKRPAPKTVYVIAADPSEGIGGDPGAGVVYERATGEHVATIHGQFSTWEFARILNEVGREFNTALLIVERNNHGHSVIQALERVHRYPNMYRSKDKKTGWLTGPVSRATALDGLHDAHREGTWWSPDQTSVAEMLRFVIGFDGKPAAAPGDHDDLVIAHAIAWDVLGKPIQMLDALREAMTG